MHWLLVRPAIGWGAFLLIHAIGIPLVYGAGKVCCAKRGKCESGSAGQPEKERSL